MQEEDRDHTILDEIEAALIRLSTGWQAEELHMEEVIDPESGAVKQIKRKRTTKTMKPDYRAMNFWLTNRTPERWRSKPPSELPEATGDVGDQWHDEDWTG